MLSKRCRVPGRPVAARCRLLLLAALIPAAFAVAQDQPDTQPPATEPTATQPAPPPATQPTPPTATQEAVVELAATEVNAETIQSQIARIENDGTIPQAAKNEAMGLLKQAQEQLNLAASSSARLKELRKGIEDAPSDLEQARNRLALTTQPSTAAAPETLKDLPLEALTQKLEDAEATLRRLQEEESRFAEAARQRAERRQAIPDQLTETNKRLEGIRKDLALTPDAAVHPQVAQAKRLFLMAQRRAANEEVRLLQTELQFYEVRGEVLATRREEARLAVVAAKARLEPIQQLVDQRREEARQRQKEQAQREQRAKIPAIRELAAENARLAAEQSDLSERIRVTELHAQQAMERNTEVEDDFAYLEENISRPGVAALIGPLMRKKKAELHDLHAFERQIRPPQGEYSRVVLRLSTIEEQSASLIALKTEVDAIVEGIIEAQPSLLEQSVEIEARVRDLLTTRREQLASLQRDYNAYFDDLTTLNSAYGTLSGNIAAMDEFIASRILWIRSAPPLYKTRLPADLAALPRVFGTIGRAILHDVRGHIGLYALAVLTLVMLVLVTPRIRAMVLSSGERVSKVTTDSFVATVRGLIGTVVLSAVWPAALIFLSRRVLAAVDATDVAAYDLGAALAVGLQDAAVVWFTLKLFRLICMPDGLAELHFRWDAMTVNRIQANLAWFHVPAVVLVLVVSAAEAYPPSGYRDTFGRVGYIVLMVLVMVLARRLLHPSEGIIATNYRKDTGHWMYRTRHFWYGGALLAMAALAVSSAIGFHYTATELTEQTGRTLWFGLEVLLVHALLARWVFFHRRRMVLDVARKKRAASAAAKPASPEGGAVAVEETTIDVDSVSEQTLRLLRSAALVVLAIGIWLIWSGMLPAVGFLDDIEIWHYTETASASESGGDGTPLTVSITLADLMLSLLAGVLTFVLARNIPGLLEIAVLRHFNLDVGGRFAITAITRYVITVVGIVVAFNMIGIGWSKVQWLAAAITVGLGFGLQEIFANFVSGLMLLFERPIRIGDTVTVGDVSGTVARIRIRATTITGWDRKELVIPNKEFVTGQVINWTLSDSVLRVIVPVGVAYGSDIELALATLKRVADEQPTVVSDPEPRVLFMGFGDSTLNLEVRVYIGRIDDYLNTISGMHCAIDREFRKAGIEIAFPQRDIHVRSIRAALPIDRQGLPSMPPQAPAVPVDASSDEV